MSRWMRQQRKRARKATLRLAAEEATLKKIALKCGPVLERMVALVRRNPRLPYNDAMQFASQELRVKIPASMVAPLLRAALKRSAPRARA
jgi:hypothetical protein